MPRNVNSGLLDTSAPKNGAPGGDIVTSSGEDRAGGRVIGRPAARTEWP
jgi:hypothetical protein